MECVQNNIAMARLGYCVCIRSILVVLARFWRNLASAIAILWDFIIFSLLNNSRQQRKNIYASNTVIHSPAYQI